MENGPDNFHGHESLLVSLGFEDEAILSSTEVFLQLKVARR